MFCFQTKLKYCERLNQSIIYLTAQLPIYLCLHIQTQSQEILNSPGGWKKKGQVK